MTKLWRINSQRKLIRQRKVCGLLSLKSTLSNNAEYGEGGCDNKVADNNAKTQQQAVSE